MLDSCFQGSWFAIQVKNRKETLTSNLLAYKGYTVFMPLKRRQVCSRTTQNCPRQSLLPGYIFLRYDSNIHSHILGTPGVIRIVGTGQSPVPVPYDEIQRLLTVEHSGLPVEECTYLHAGQSVLVVEGPLAGVEGILKAVRNRNHLVVAVHLLRRSVCVELPSSSVVSYGFERSVLTAAGNWSQLLNA